MKTEVIHNIRIVSFPKSPNLSLALLTRFHHWILVEMLDTIREATSLGTFFPVNPHFVYRIQELGHSWVTTVPNLSSFDRIRRPVGRRQLKSFRFKPKGRSIPPEKRERELQGNCALRDRVWTDTDRGGRRAQIRVYAEGVSPEGSIRGGTSKR